MLKRKYMLLSLLTLVSILLGGLFYCNLVQANSTGQVFSDDFDDGDISDWTVTTTGTATFDVSTDTCVSSPYSVHMKSLGDSMAIGVSPSYSLDLTKDYTVSFYFLIPHTDNHWFEVFNNHQIYIVIDDQDELKSYDGTLSYLISELATNQWYPIEIKAHPSSSSYDVYVNGTFKKTCSMWIHSGWENSFRIGDRADNPTDYGEAYWDDIYIYQTECGEVKFIGVVACNETTSDTVCYLSPYCNVSVERILYDPNGTLNLGAIVSVCYNQSLSLTVGERVECYGYYYKKCDCPMQVCGHVVCIGDGYYVKRFPPPVGGFWIPAAKLALLAPYIALVSTITLAISISVAYLKHRKKR